MSLLINVVVPSVYAWVSEKSWKWSIQNGLVRLHEKFTPRFIRKCMLYDLLWQGIHIAALSISPNLFTVDDQVVLYLFFLLFYNIKTTIWPILIGFLCILWNVINQIGDLSGSVANRFLGDLPLVAVISFFSLSSRRSTELQHSVGSGSRIRFRSWNWNELFV